MGIEKIIVALPKKSTVERPKMRANAMSQLDQTDPKKVAEAQQFLSALEAHERQEQLHLIDELQSLRAAERIKLAFTKVPMTETEAKLIQVLLDNPGSISTELSEKLGWGGQAWHLHFGTMCANRSVYLWPAPDSEIRTGKFYSGILADLKEPENHFTMKSEVAAAFADLGLKGRAW